MLNRFAIGKRLTLGFGLVVAILVGAVGGAVLGFRSLHLALAEVKRDSAQIVLAKDAHAHALQAMAYIGAVATTSDPGRRQEEIDVIKAQRAAYGADLKELKSQLTTEAERRLLADLEAAIATSREGNSRVMDLSSAGNHAEAVRVYSEDACPKILLWNTAFDHLNQSRQAIMQAAMETAESRIRHNIWGILAAGVLAIGAAGTLGYLITHSITRPVQGFMGVLARVAEGDLTVRARVDSRDEIGSLGASLNQALGRLGGTLQEVSRAALSVASGATQLSASAEQMSSTTQELARNGERLNTATGTVSSAAVQFLASVEQVTHHVKVSVDQTDQAVNATEAGAEGNRDAAERMTRIREATAKIASAVEVIQEIARQTNLLSLNAAIEAAKAGDKGKGFSVVAEEVRKLAERSRAATVEIEGLIQDTHAAVEGGVASVRTTSGLMTRIHESIGKVASLAREIGSATHEQFRAAGEISRRMEESAREVGQNATATQELSAAVGEITRTATDLARVSETMAVAVAKFQV